MHLKERIANGMLFYEHGHKDPIDIAQEQELQEQIDAEEERSKEIDSLEEYVGTDEYIEQTAKDRLNLVHENEIIFKKK